MWPVSSQWDPAWRDGGQLAVRAEVWKSGARQTLPDGSTSLRVSGGTVTVDETSKVRRTLTLTVANTDVDPVSAGDLLAPFGTDLRPYAGIVYTDGSIEYAPLGVFRLTEPARPGLLQPLTLTGSDYARVMTDARFLTPWVTSPGVLITTEIRAMALDAVPGLTVLDYTGSRATTTSATWEKDRWEAMLALAQAIGAELYFDATGALVIRPMPITPGASVWSCDAGSPSANLLDVAVGLSGSGVYNAVVATSAPAGQSPVTAIAYQQSGPLAWSTGWRRPRFWSTQLPMTVDQLNATATALLARSVAVSRQMDPTSLPNYALEAGDPITVRLPTGTSEVRFASRFTLPLEPGVMPLTTRVAADVGLASWVGGLS